MSPAEIKFGTDGWRAVIGEGFNEKNVQELSRATARTFLESASKSTDKPSRIYVGYDTREGADRYARLAAEVMTAEGLEVILSDRYIPTPTLCWTVSRDETALGGVQLTASHNPAGWLGFKVRMSDGGASPAEFTDAIEENLKAQLADSPEQKAPTNPTTLDSQAALKDSVKIQPVCADLITPYLDALRQFIDTEAISKAHLKVLVDPLYGAARSYLADTFERLGVEVTRLHDEADPNFGGLHPEPIPPWTDAAAAQLRDTDAQAGFVLDGDADRLGALDEEGNFVSPHQIIALIAQHLIENHAQSGRIIKTLSTSTIVDRIGRELGVEVTTTPVGFKWIYEEMLGGDVMLGGEESGGIGIPGHVRERDGLLMSLLLTEMMAQTGLSLKQLVTGLEERVGKLYYQRNDLCLELVHMEALRKALPTLAPAQIAGTPVEEYVHSDGAKFILADGGWLLLRASGTEPLVRIYAEANSPQRVKELLAAGNQLVQEAA